MSNIRRVTKSTNCVDCYNNNPFQQNEGLKSYAKMISNHTNTESCKSCEPCYDPYLKKVFTEGCLTGEGTECNPLSIDLDCIPSGGVSSCTITTPDCCDYILENIVFGQVCINFTENNYVFGIETQFIIGVNRVGGGADGFGVLMEGSYTKQELIDFVYSSWQFSADITTIEKTENGVCITVTKPTSDQLGCSLSLPEGISDCSVYDVSGTYSVQSQTCEGVFGLSAIFGTKFQVNINNSWTDLTENALEGTWESICDTRDITSYRILDEVNDVLYSGNLEPQDCRGGGEEITKSICEWIDYLYNQTNNPSSNECTLTTQNCNQVFSIEILQDEFLAVLSNNVFTTQNFFIEYSTGEESYRLSETPVVLNEGENTVITSDIISNLFNNWIENNFFNIVREGNKLTLASKTCLEGFIYLCTDNFGNSENESLIVTPSFIDNTEVKLNSEIVTVSILDEGELYWIAPLVIEETTETKSFCDWISYLYNEVSGENLYNSNGTLTSNRTLDGDDKTLFFQNLRSFGVEAQPQDNDIYGIALGNNQEGIPYSLAGIILGGIGKNKGIQLSGITTGDDGAGTAGIEITGNNTETTANDIVINPQNGRLAIQNITEVTGMPYIYGEDNQGYTRKIEYNSPSAENLYNSNGTLLSNRTLEGDDKSLTFTGLKSFSVNATSNAQPYSINLKGLNIGNGSGININGFGLGNGVLINGGFNDSNNAAVGISLNSVDRESGTGVTQIGIKIRGKAKTKGLEIIGNSDQNIGTSIIGTTQRDTKADEYSAGLILSGSNLSTTSNDMPGLKIRGQITGGTANHIEIVAGTEVGAGRITISNLPTDNTALQVASKDSNDRLVWRDVSSIASSLPSNVCKMIGIDFTKNQVSTNLTNQVFGSVLIPANTFGIGSSLIEVETLITRLNGGINPNLRLFINTSISFSGATQIGLISVTPAARWVKGERTFECGTNFIRGLNSVLSGAIDNVPVVPAPTQIAVNWSINQYILTVADNATGIDTTQHEFTSVELKKV